MSIWHGNDPLILASQSRARQALLADAGIPFEAMPAHIDEREIQRASGLVTPGAIASLLAGQKALFISSRQPGRVVIGADQNLALEQRLFTNPRRSRAGGRAVARAFRQQP